MDKYFIYQGNDHDCGFASLKMLLAILNKNKSYLYLEKEEKVEYFTFQDLKNIAQNYNVILEGYYDEDRFLGESMKLPCLISLSKEGEYSHHVVVVTKIKRDKVFYLDPAHGSKVSSIEDLRSRYDGHYLIVDSFQPYELNIKEEHFLSGIQASLLTILPFMSTILLSVGFYFIRKDEYVLLPIIFLFLFVLLELISSWYSLKCIDSFDAKYTHEFMKRVGDKKKEHVELYNNFKKLLFVNRRTLISSLITITVIVFVLVFNDVYNSIPLISIIALSGLERIIFKDKAKKKEFGQIETEIFKEETFDFISDFHDLERMINKYAMNLSLRRLAMSFICLGASIAMMILSKLASTNFVIFHFFLYFSIYEAMNKAFDVMDKETEYLKLRSRFLDILTFNKKSDDMI